MFPQMNRTITIFIATLLVFSATAGLPWNHHFASRALASDAVTGGQETVAT